MAVLKIARMGHSILRTKSIPVARPFGQEIHRLVEDMIHTLNDSGGVGLAAPQVHNPLRLVIFKVPAAQSAPDRYKAAGLDENCEEVPLTVLINPEIEVIGNTYNPAFEGCLSLPDMMGLVNRYSHIIYRGFGLNGEPIEREARDFHARVVQHECDHLDGILYPQRISDFSTFGYSKELMKSAGPAESDESIEKQL